MDVTQGGEEHANPPKEQLGEGFGQRLSAIKNLVGGVKNPFRSKIAAGAIKKVASRGVFAFLFGSVGLPIIIAFSVTVLFTFIIVGSGAAGVPPSPEPTPTPTTSPTIPDCNTNGHCDACVGAPTNTCFTNNGTCNYIYDQFFGGGSCSTVSTPGTTCTYDNCDPTFSCVSGSCVAM